MTIYMRAAAVREATTGGPLRFTASTEGVKRDGKNLKVDKWLLDNYRANPVVLWAHDYTGARLPIGRAEVSVENRALMAEVTFDPQDEFAQAVEQKYRSGFLSTVSVGWDETKDGYDLLDISAVPVPGDPQALLERQAGAQRALDAGEADWQRAATAMVDVLLDSTADDAERQKRYHALLPKYRRAKKTAPEFLPAAHMRALGAEERRALFLEGEYDMHQRLTDAERETVAQMGNQLMEMMAVLKTLAGNDAPAEEPQPADAQQAAPEPGARIGATLSARNREKLQAARDAIDEVLKSAAPAEATENTERTLRAVNDALGQYIKI